MREGIGSIALYNIIIIFIVVTFAILAGTMSYSKAFKSNNRIINIIEKYEGYNEASAEKINLFLSSIGYQAELGTKCPKRNGNEAMDENLNPDYRFCVYPYVEETSAYNDRYVTYGVVTYIRMDVLGYAIRIPVYGKSNRVFCFKQNCINYIKFINEKE